MKAITTSQRGRPKRLVPANDNQPDLGTHELQLKRATLAQGTDPAATAHPLDLLRARGLVTAQEHRAGWRYAGLYRRVIGRTDVSYGRLYDGLRGEGGRAAMGDGDEESLGLAQQSFRQAQAMLRAEGPVVAGMTERLAVFGAWPDWLLQPIAQSMTRVHREIDLLRRGLTKLVMAARGQQGRGPHANDNDMPQVMS